MPGVATGLAVTGAGGDVLFIEATAHGGRARPDPDRPARRRDEGVGAHRAVLPALARRELGLDPNALAGRRIHLHVPAGAVPKDGPSAGITMVTALASLASGRPVRPEFGMTGEVTLAGRVLPIGGVKQKLLAAHRAGLTEVIIPARNEPDLDDLPDEVRDGADRAHPGRRRRRARAGAAPGRVGAAAAGAAWPPDRTGPTRRSRASGRPLHEVPQQFDRVLRRLGLHAQPLHRRRVQCRRRRACPGRARR